jgi:hypothetical protein
MSLFIIPWITNVHEEEKNQTIESAFLYFVSIDEKVIENTFPNISPNTFDKQMFEV